MSQSEKVNNSFNIESYWFKPAYAHVHNLLVSKDSHKVFFNLQCMIEVIIWLHSYILVSISRWKSSSISELCSAKLTTLSRVLLSLTKHLQNHAAMHSAGSLSKRSIFNKPWGDQKLSQQFQAVTPKAWARSLESLLSSDLVLLL